MKTIKLLIVTLFCLTMLPIAAQKKAKIKGSKIVVDVFENLEAFNEIEINDGLEVSLMQTNANGYSLKIDSNLVDVVKFKVMDSVLKIYQTHRITSSKKLELAVTFQNLNKMTLRNGAKIEGQNKFILDSLAMTVSDNSDFELDVETQVTNIIINGSSKGKIQLKSENSKITLNDNAFLRGSFSMNNLDLTLNARSDINIEGDVINMNLITTGSTDIKAKNLKTTNASLQASNSSDIYLYVSKELGIYAKGKSNIYVYGTPHITVDGLNDKSQIIKK
ncbi:GIN domain-containing protein [Winogradskyella sp. Asnod2-B02-A]|uniref:GIN domain-containing protein n=1 Tax=Winogradskyella sp. Asnod2-B02-A TaxID=3160583 RepID=UPI00386B36D7